MPSGAQPARALVMAQETRVQHLLGDDDDAEHRLNVQNTEVSLVYSSSRVYSLLL